MTRPAIRPELPSGTLIGGDYEVLERLAGGGMGEVYLARQRSTGALRAVKRLHAHLLSDEVSRTRFEREAKVVAKIESQHVAQVVAAGIDRERGEPFIAMEYLRGATVSKLVANGPCSFDEALRVMMGVGHALAAAHRAGVVHRDLKPDNVMLAESQLAGVSTIVKVLDFGIALVAKGTLSARITGDLSVGTPPYMAPEQFSDSQRIGPHTDVWAMGLLLFEMLTGQRFWNSSAKTGGTLASLIQEIVEQPISPSALRAREKGGSIAPPIAAWIDLCLQREPTHRFDQAQPALDALVRAARGAPLEAPLSGAAQPRAHVAPVTLSDASTTAIPPAAHAAPSSASPPPAPTPTVRAVPAQYASAPHTTAAPPRTRNKSLLVVGAIVAAAALVTAVASIVVTLRADRDARGELDAVIAARSRQVTEPQRAIEPPSTVNTPPIAPIAPIPRPEPMRVERPAQTPPNVLAHREPESPSRPSSPTPTRAPATRPSGAGEPSVSRMPPTAAARDAQLRAIVYRAVRSSGCFNERTIASVRGSVMVTVSDSGRILSASTDSNYWSCLVRVRLTGMEAPRWGSLYRASFPLDQMFR
ncbi:MAG: serine/threonine protein kinase [Myxococcales bacterium]|nr:serine/threonine protein kinase [Myxococcales bacterium]